MVYLIHNQPPDLQQVKRLTREQDINQVDSQKWTALFYAAVFSTPEALEVVIDAGANLQYTDSNGDNVLINYIQSSSQVDQRVLRILMERVELDHQNLSGFTAMHYMAMNRFDCEQLVIRGASYSIRNDNGDTAFTLSENPALFFKYGYDLKQLTLEQFKQLDIKILLDIFQAQNLLLKKVLRRIKYCVIEVAKY